MNKKIILSLLTVILAVGGIMAGVALVKQKQKLEKKAAAATNLSFSPSFVSVVRGQNFSVSSRMDTGSNAVTGIDIDIRYNPAVIQISQVQPTSAISNFTQLVTSKIFINNDLGEARYVAFTIDSASGVTGNVNILTITGSVLSTAAPGSYQITYGRPPTLIIAVGEGDALQNVFPGTIIVTTPTPTPTATPMGTHTPTLTPTPTVTPTRTPTPTPTATPQPKIGDVNGDGHVNLTDIGIVVDFYDMDVSLKPKADVNGDGSINLIDIGIIVDHYEL